MSGTRLGTPVFVGQVIGGAVESCERFLPLAPIAQRRGPSAVVCGLGRYSGVVHVWWLSSAVMAAVLAAVTDWERRPPRSVSRNDLGTASGYLHLHAELERRREAVSIAGTSHQLRAGKEGVG